MLKDDEEDNVWQDPDFVVVGAKRRKRQRVAVQKIPFALMKLPGEIVRSIAEYMKNTNVLAWSGACKHFYNILREWHVKRQMTSWVYRWVSSFDLIENHASETEYMTLKKAVGPSVLRMTCKRESKLDTSTTIFLDVQYQMGKLTFPPYPQNRDDALVQFAKRRGPPSITNYEDLIGYGKDVENEWKWLRTCRQTLKPVFNLRDKNIPNKIIELRTQPVVFSITFDPKTKQAYKMHACDQTGYSKSTIELNLITESANLMWVVPFTALPKEITDNTQMFCILSIFERLFNSAF